MEAEKNSTHPKVLKLGDDMYREAVKAKDKKAQCLAYTFPIKYFSHIGEEQKLTEAAANLRNLAKANGYMQYYYYAYRMEVIFFYNRKQLIAALQKAEEMKAEAFAGNDKMGIFYSMRFMGDIYFTRRNYELSIQYYKETLDFILKELPEQDPSSIYINIANLYYLLNDNKESMNYYDKALKASRQKSQKVKALSGMCIVCYYIGDTDGFNTHYHALKELTKERAYPSLADKLWRVECYKNIIDRNYDAAQSVVDSIENRQQKLEALKQISVSKDDYKKVYEYSNLIRQYNDSLNNMLMQSNIEEMNVILNNDKLKWDNMQLNLANTLLEQRQLKQELTLKESAMETYATRLRNKELENEKTKIKAHLLKSEMEKHKAVEAQQKIAYENHKNRLKMRAVMLACVLVVVILMLLYLVNRHRQKKKTIVILQEKNNELTKARNEAETANIMKTEFIQNMSHEIRTPLNAIVGFTNLILESGADLEEKEKQEFGEIINTNCELLTTLVNDILKVSELESNTYEPHLALHNCNEICRIAVSTVMHRKPENVKLYFTSDAADDFSIKTDGQRVEQVLINFLTNAEKHTEQGEIHLHCSLVETPGKVTFSVTDTGTGIPADQAEAIFERFKKLDRFKQGIGLGLNICRMIAQKLHGEVKLDTSYTGGSRFLFILPIE